MLGLQYFTDWLARLLDHLPALAAGLLIVVAGYVLSGFVGDLVQATATRLAPPQRRALSRLARGRTLAVALLVGADQIGLKVTWLAILAAVIVASVLGGVTLAVSLGARGYVANLIGALYLRQAFQIGQRVRVAGFEGRIVEVTATSLVLETSDGRMLLPGARLHDEPIVLCARSRMSGADGGFRAIIHAQPRLHARAPGAGRTGARDAAAGDAAQLFARVPARLGAAVLAAMLPHRAALCIGGTGRRAHAGVAGEMGTQPTVALLRHFPRRGGRRLIGGLPTAAALASTLLLGYAEDSLGAWADPDVVALAATTRAADALERVRAAPPTHPVVFVADGERRLAGRRATGRLLIRRRAPPRWPR